ncbi:fimbria/pilus outer membrane usher protein [Vibrio sp. E150_018]
MRFHLFNAFLIYISLISCSTNATEFNSYFIKSENEVDLSNFEKGNHIKDGNYLLDLYFNQDYLDTENLTIISNQLCIDKKTLKSLPLNEKGLKIYKKTLSTINDNQCFRLINIEYTTIDINLGKGRVDISMPQEYLAENYKNGFVEPKQWNDGISGIFLDYHMNYFSTKQNSDASWDNNLTTYGMFGANTGPVRLRAQYQKTDDTSGEFTSYYGYIPIRNIQSKFTFGNTQFASSVYDSFNMIGVNLQNDDKMLPSYLRGYSPTISGTVDSNAVITITQQGRVLKVVNVNAGPYIINNLSQTSQGDINVEVKQANGKTQNYQLNGADVQYLTRPGKIRYSFSAGVPNSKNYEYTPGFLSVESAYGLNNTLSLFSGTLLSNKYQSYTLGSGVNINQFGALSFDVSLAQAELEREGKVTGTSYGFSYNTTLTDWGLGLRVAGYRFSEKQFYEFDEYLHTYDDYTIANIYASNNNKKDEKYITLTQSIKDISLFLSYNSRNYWDNRRYSERYDITASKPFTISGLTFYVNANIYHSVNSYANYNNENGLTSSLSNDNENGWGIGISIPLGNGDTVSMQTKVSDHKYSQNMAYAGKDESRNANYRLSFDEYEGQSIGASGSYNRDFSYVSTSVGGSYQTDDYRQVNASASGTLLLTNHGLAYSNLNAGDTRLLIDTKVPDVAIQGTGKQSSNSFGLAVVNGVTPYQKSWNTIDYKSLPDNVEVLDSIKSTVLTEGAIGFQTIRARQGESFLAQLSSSQLIPFGASIFDVNTNEEIGIVGSDQTVYLSGVNNTSFLKVSWGNNDYCHISINEEQLNNNNIRQLECI